MPEDLPLDADLIKVLASDTRRDILRLLQDRNMTVTELSRELDLGKATVHEHLNKLNNAGLIQRREDERLWVYYEVSPQGKRMLNPQRTRFYLIVAGAVAAGLVAVVALGLFLTLGGGPTGSPEGAGEHAALTVQPTDTSLYGSGPVTFDAVVQSGDGQLHQVRGYLLSPEDAQRLQAGEPVQGVPLDLTTGAASMAAATDADSSTDTRESTKDSPQRSAEDGQASGAVTFSARSSLPPGTYFLYIQDADGSDNLQTMPALQVRGLEAELSHTTWYQGLSGNLTIQVTSEREPANGTLVIEQADAVDPAHPAPSLSLPLDEGRAQVPVRSLDQAEPGTYRLRVLPEGASDWQLLAERLTVVRPSYSLQPLHLVTAPQSQLTLHTYPVEARTPDLNVSVNGSDLQGIDHGPDGTRILLDDTRPGTLELRIGRLAQRQVTVHPDLVLTVEVHDGPRWVLDLAHSNATPIPEASVLLNGALVGHTNETGHLALDVPEEGIHQLAVQTPAGHRVARELQVTGWDPSPADPRLTVTAAPLEATPGRATVQVTVTNDAEVPVPATLSARLDTQPLTTRSLQLAANASQDLQLTLPIQEGGRHQLDLSATALELPHLQVLNRTSQAQHEADDSSGSDGADAAAGTAEAPATALEAKRVASTSLEVELPGTESAAAAFAAADQPEREPVFPGGLRAADDVAAETPLPGLAPVLAILVALATVLARARRR